MKRIGALHFWDKALVIVVWREKCIIEAYKGKWTRSTNERQYEQNTHSLDLSVWETRVLVLSWSRCAWRGVRLTTRDGSASPSSSSSGKKALKPTSWWIKAAEAKWGDEPRSHPARSVTGETPCRIKHRKNSKWARRPTLCFRWGPHGPTGTESWAQCVHAFFSLVWAFDASLLRFLDNGDHLPATYFYRVRCLICGEWWSSVFVCREKFRYCQYCTLTTAIPVISGLRTRVT